MWDFKIFQGSLTNGVLATAGGVVFAASATAISSRSMPKTGKYLWRFQTGGNMAASPMSYAVDGKQYVAVAAGNSMLQLRAAGVNGMTYQQQRVRQRLAQSRVGLSSASSVRRCRVTAARPVLGAPHRRRRAARGRDAVRRSSRSFRQSATSRSQ